MATDRGIGLRRVMRLLRSPRFALWIIGLSAVYLLIGTLLPQTPNGVDEVRAWAAAHPTIERVVGPLGLHHAYGTPVLWIGLALLAFSTGLCAWDRTRRAWRVAASGGTVTPDRIASLRVSPTAVVPLEGPDESVLDGVRIALTREGLHVRSGPRLLEARAGVWGLFGSPVFHWAVLALLLVVPLGRLTRAEGVTAVVLGTSVRDEPSAYPAGVAGPLHRGGSGLTISVAQDMPLHFEQGGVDRGAAPTVTLVDSAGRSVATGRVYPNSPLHHGNMTVHMLGYGAGVVVSLVTSGPTESSEYAADWDTAARFGTAPIQVGLTGPSGARLATATIEVHAADYGGAFVDELPQRPKATLTLERPGSAATERVLSPGDEISIGEGSRIRLERITYYARLSVVDDWSVRWIYALLCIASAAIAVSVLVPYRAVWVLLDPKEGSDRLRVTVRHSRGDPGFTDRVLEAIRSAEEDA